MKFRILASTLITCFLATSTVMANTEVNNSEENIKKELSSKIVEVDNLIKSLKSVQNNVTYASSSNERRTSKVNPNHLIDEANNIHLEVEDFFQNVDSEEFYQSEETYNLIDKLDKMDLEVNKVKEKNVIKAAATSWRAGDILYYGVGSDNAAGEKSFTGHTAVLSTTDNFVIEAARTKNNGAKVHHWDRTNLWRGATGIKQYKVVGFTGNDANSTNRTTAVQFGLDQKGEPYSLKTSIFTSSEWYCSKLTMRQWYDAGYDLRGGRGLTLSGFLLVVPADIQIDANTRLLKDWGSNLPVNI